jgi:hypothetical protein
MTNDTEQNEQSTSGLPATPELDRQSEIIHSGKAEVIQEFIDWIHDERHYHLAEYIYESTEPCPGQRRDPFDPSNCEDGKVKKSISLWEGSKRIGRIEGGQTCAECGGTGEVTVTFRDPKLLPVLSQPEQLMADFFGIDRNKIETERRALLDYMRSHQ